MRLALWIILFLLAGPIYGQTGKGDFMTSGSLAFRNYYKTSNIYKTFELNLANKTGYFIGKNLAVGVQTEFGWSREKIHRYSIMQTPGSQWYQEGRGHAYRIAVGLFADKYYRLDNKLFISSGLYTQYYRGKFYEEGRLVNPDGSDAGVSFTTDGTEPLRVKAGLNSYLLYFFKKNIALNCKLAELNFDFKRAGVTEFSFTFPVMNLGVQLHF